MEKSVMKNDAATEWAVIQKGLAIYGTGNSRHAAIADSAQWLEINGRQGGGTADDVESILVDEHSANVGDLYVTSNSDVIADYIREQK